MRLSHLGKKSPDKNRLYRLRPHVAGDFRIRQSCQNILGGIFVCMQFIPAHTVKPIPGTAAFQAPCLAIDLRCVRGIDQLNLSAALHEDFING